MMTKHDEKEQLRSACRARRDALPEIERTRMSEAITKRVLALVGPHATVMAYASKEPEVETMPLLCSLIRQGKHLVLPIIQREDRTLRLSYVRSPDALSPSTFGVPEPVECEEPAEAASLDIIIVPLIGFDREGNRIGYGAGYYDRFFSAHPHIPSVGVAFSVQECPHIPAERFDHRLDYIVTEQEIIKIREI
ncbi:hypothetical protein AZH53_05105 [Methanomicrobiaceae archaeon CYW5]|uniref:5-formyltetrahydrofolate cyclo-ligase n=1 Tax=Methanovulcanius yangii TaxID=1789227 RepID=UPI0029CAA698|nr:5-formyltetrahydrofolate cyclo-ligase [Methanovulcanius yangii]MBT8507795.1 hypothetical protein [Methanovulcanius yangii]